MKRQQHSSLLSSSSRRQSSPENLHAQTIGCMSGLFHLISKYQKRRKFLTFAGKKSEKIPEVSSAKKGAKSHDDGKEKDQIRRLVPRSPTLPAEIRRSNSAPALVARLMGLGPAAPESAAEKRRKLLGALERCDRDLKALKKIVEAVQSRTTSPGGDCDGDQAKKRCSSATNGEQPSPVSVLDELTRSPLCSYTRRSHATCAAATAGGEQQQLKKRPGAGEDETIIKVSMLMSSECFEESRRSVEIERERVRRRRRKGVIESVNEACRDVAWGQNRELRRIGLALHDLICTDLIHDFLKEMTLSSSSAASSYSLPFHACKRKLRF